MTQMHGFELVEERNITDINTRARLWRHINTGAELLSLENDDDNKVFGITFRTPSNNSTGIAHIMEHSVLCGSQKYPVKEPFVELIKGSLNTFLNAFTYPDKTCYPVASTNLQDFYNMIDVYLDAVLHPLITPYTLAQEGWHHELQDIDGEMTYKGVVYNEMKGAYSSADSVLEEESRHSLFPNTIYGHDSGGNPENILDLTWADFQKFHETFYHPSNSRVFFYGDDDPEKRLKIMNAAFEGYERIDVDSKIPLQPQFDHPRYQSVPYDSGDDPEAKAQLTVNWMLPPAGTTELTLGLDVLAHILIGTSAAPLQKALIDSGLGEDTTGVGFESGLQQMMFSVGLKGISETDAGKVEKLILDTLAHLASQGIDPETIAASLNTIEFALRENNTGSFPRGLALMLRSLDSWLYGKDPFEPLALEAPLGKIKNRLATGEKYFEGLIREVFLNNPHRVTILLQPDADLGERRAAAEKERLAGERSTMTPAQLEKVVETTHELIRRQETPDTPEALATIPMLKLEDLDRKIKTIPSVETSIGNGKILYHDLFTNGILYMDLGFNLHGLRPEWLPYIPVFSRALVETGTKQLSFVQLIQRIGQKTGGIRPTTFTSAVRGQETGTAWFIVRAKAMLAQTPDLLALLREILFESRLDNRERIAQIVLENKAGFESTLVDAGHRVVNQRLKARFNDADWASEQMSGVEQLFFLRGLVEKIQNDWPAVQKTLEDIRAALFNQAGSLCNITLDQTGYSAVQQPIAEFLHSLPSYSYTHTNWQPSLFARLEGLSLPTQVNYVGKGANLYQLGYKLHGSALVIVPYLRGTWLWEKVRVQGGAYGGFATFDNHSGVFNLLSYRDPNLDQTLKIYDQTADYLRKIKLSEAEQTKAIIGAIGEVDAYQLPDAKGYTSMVRHLLGITDEERQRIRDEILATTEADFHAFGDILGGLRLKGDVVVVGSPNAIQTSQLSQETSFKTTKVL